MAEIIPAAGGMWRIGFAGDSYNTAVYLSRFGHEVSYVSCVGSDALSEQMVAAFHEEALKTDMLFRHPTRTIGLYLVGNDENGERHFTYWRDSSAAKTLMDEGRKDKLRPELGSCDLIYLSGVSLAILPEDGRAALLELFAEFAVPVVFDPNYRPGLWSEVSACRSVCATIAPLASHVLVTRDDESLLWETAGAEESLQRWSDMGAGEIVVKDGSSPVWVRSPGVGDEAFECPKTIPVDTTGAGDAFNAAYIHQRLQQKSVADSVAAGQALARLVIGEKGAIIERSLMSGLL